MNEKLKSENKKNEVRILIVDDHPIVRRGLKDLIDQEPDFVVRAQAGDALEALEAVEEQPFDLAVVDISLKEINGIQLTEKIHSLYPNMPVLILTMHHEAAYCERALRAGASGYVMKNEAAEKVITAIRSLLCGKAYISETLMRNSSEQTSAEGWFY